jgi:hypothetical protein
LIFPVFIFVLVTESISRHRRQYSGYGNPQQYGSQYGMYAPGGQGWVNNDMNNRYQNQPGYNWNNNLNWNQANRRPEWYYNTSNTIQSSILCFIFPLMYILSIV